MVYVYLESEGDLCRCTRRRSKHFSLKQTDNIHVRVTPLRHTDTNNHTHTHTRVRIKKKKHRDFQGFDTKKRRKKMNNFENGCWNT